MGEKATYSPEVVDQEVEDAENDDQHDGAELGLETNNNHDASDETNERDNDSPKRPLAAPDEADEQEDQENATSELEVHLSVLLVERRQASESLGFPDPRIGEHHQETTNDGQVAQEEVEVEDQAVAESLDHHDAHQTSDRVVGVLADDDHGGTGDHGNDVDNEEDVVKAARDCCFMLAFRGCANKSRREFGSPHTMPVVVKV